MDSVFQKCGEDGKESRFAMYEGRLFQFDNLHWETVVEGRDYFDSDHLNDISFRGAIKLIPLKEVPAEETRQLPYREYDINQKKWGNFEPFGFVEGAMVEVTKKGQSPASFTSAYTSPNLPCAALLSKQPIVRSDSTSTHTGYNEQKKVKETSLKRASKPQILHIKKAKYTEEARENKVQGEVVLSVILSADGKIANVEVLKGLPYGLTENAIKAAQQIRFRPATKNGQAVSVRQKLVYGFTLY
nr:energy transducer TonB [Nitrosomonas nitrosa]